MNTNELSIDEILKLISTLERIDRVDMPALEERLNTPVNRALKKQVLERALKRKPGRPKLHWKTRAKRLRKRKQRYYQQTAKPRRKALSLEAVRDGDWYTVCAIQWKKRGTPVALSKVQWDTNVAHTIPEGRIPVVIRYNAKLPISLENIEVIDNETREVYFSGLDFAFYKAQSGSPQATGVIE